ncbi:hypothetical protein GOP47_0019157 [Adiantum capillus-veneris]|uniref:Uncharacterized protein n=1 Tax=Adiantum capillus-veneris TaxID=13818 RepID=A0A9D4Z8U0_ADICA|nr:hypothetical protein GOP47_0019157 [Adiantum capillus-veneris]
MPLPAADSQGPSLNLLGQPPPIYFVDREAYLGVMQSHCYKRSNATVPDERYPAYRPPPWEDERNAALRPLCKLYRSLSRKGLTPLEVIEEVGNRHCSREEDRVSSILGLFHVELSQLRTGKGLAMQIVELAKVCSLEMLVELCGMDVVDCCTIGMSWAPDFANSSRHSFWSTHVLPELQEQQLEVAMERQQVCADGSIKLLAKVVSGHLLAITALPAAIREMSRTTTAKYRQSHPNVTDAEQPTHFIVVPMLNIDNTIPSESEVAFPASNSLLPQNISLESCCFIPLDLYPTKTNQSTLNLNFFFNWQTGSSHGGSFHIPIDLAQTHDLNSLTDLVVSFPIQMVLLGGAPTAIKHGDNFKVIMVCLSKTAAADTGEREEQLHKVGMLYLTEMQEWGLQMKYFEKAGMSECLIGGFGANLSHYVSLQHDVSGEVCILDRPPGGYVPIRKSW